ncbi:MAG: hypothetical protein LC734_00795 [Acidobacteria bacterium]|nr:hypothetical protein [Acidobacteriota bacterium]
MIFSKRYLLIFTLLFAATATELLAQKKNNRRPAVTPKPLVGSSETPNASPEPTPALKNAAKKNERPDSNAGDQDTKHNSSRLTSESLAPYIYEFSQPSFIVSKIVISHGDDGKGTIAFKRAGHEEMFSDPLEVSTAAMRRIDAVLDALDFVNSSENYQYEKDYAHLGTASMTIRKNGKTRTARYNYPQPLKRRRHPANRPQPREEIDWAKRKRKELEILTLELSGHGQIRAGKQEKRNLRGAIPPSTRITCPAAQARRN